jgi:DNA-nicking Smr family endonuclease
VCSKRRDADEDEEFVRAMADVTPLKRDHRGRVHARPPLSAHRTRTAEPASASPHAPLDSFAADGVDRRELRKLRRGAYPVAARLDLHGLTVADACARTRRYVDASLHRAFRCISIVHGRGAHSAGGVSKLKQQVRACLRSHPGVLAYVDAPPADGGAGAVYVLLRVGARS